MDENITCENCKYFIKHYFWNKDRLVYAYSGHCTNSQRKRLVTHNLKCEKWDIAETTYVQQNENFEKILKRTAKQINEITAILKCEYKTLRA